MYDDLGQRIALVEEDRALDRELRNCWWRSARNVGSCTPVNEAIERVGEIALTPAFHDCDPMNVVWHGNYFGTSRSRL